MALNTKIWLDAHLRQLMAIGQVFTVIHKGDFHRGGIALKIVMGRAAGCKLYTRAQIEGSKQHWLPALSGETVDEAAADAYITRLITRDPDIWVIEIEDKTGTPPFAAATSF